MKTIFYLFVALIISQNALALPFITTWKTDNLSTGSSNSTSITIPTTGTGYNYDVDWNNDGTFEQLGVTGNATHDYGVAGTYTVAIRGNFPRIYFNNLGDKSKILSVVQWGDIAWASMAGAFHGCNNLIGNAIDIPNLSGVTDLSNMFRRATSFNQNISAWNVSNVTNMSSMFWLANSFNQNIDSWDVSHVINMSGMFQNTLAFNQNLNNWNVGMVTNMSFMFFNATAFNGNISAWNVSKVTDMNTMFYSATVFNQNISSWNVGLVTNMSYMFNGASLFNQNISSWNVGNVTNLNYMFNGATAFNQNIGAWNITLATSMTDIFKNTSISLSNYDNMLMAWNNAGYTNKNLGSASPLSYCYGLIARTILTSNKGWTITGDTYNSCNSNRYFTTAWKTNNLGTSNSTSITIPTTGTGYNYDVDWNGDGVFDDLAVTGDITHDYSTAGTYVVNIKGTFPRIYFNNAGDRSKILSVAQWGDIVWASMNKAFYGCNNLSGIATDAPNLSAVTDLSYMFSEATSFNQNIGAWDVSHVTNMSNMFRSAFVFNQNLNAWNMSLVTNTATMFYSAKVFNGDISAWNVSNVTNMNAMFYDTPLFNQNISAWNVSNVTNIADMFNGATAFNQNIGPWNITLATTMTDIFKNSAISSTNYDNILLAWNTAGYTNKNLGSALPLTYCASQIARSNMITNKGWLITGDTYINTCPITSIASGNWAINNTWNAGRVPQAGDNVIIDSNHIITLDGVSNIKKLEYRGTGKLIMSTTASRVNTGL